MAFTILQTILSVMYLVGKKHQLGEKYMQQEGRRVYMALFLTNLVRRTWFLPVIICNRLPNINS